jgi:multidrug efflux system outer membrane protein
MTRTRRRANRAVKWIVVIATAPLPACVLGPNYHRPEAPAAPAAYAGASGEWKIATPRAHFPKGNWWEAFGDGDLNRLEGEARAANQELSAAAARFEQARAAAQVATSGLYPHVGVSASGARQRDSANRPVGGKPGTTYDNFGVAFDAGYELDLWGRARRRAEAARAQLEAAAADVEGIRLAIEAEVAVDYFTLRTLDAEKALLLSRVETYGKALDLVRNRRAAGIVSDLDVAQAETVLHSAEAEASATALQRTQFQHALAVLTGQVASSFSIDERPGALLAPVVPPGVPSELLERRPDIAAAERRMATANAEIGVAKAALFPSIQLGGTAGVQSASASTLFDWPSRLWSLGSSLAAPLFEGGRLRAGVRGAEAGYDEAVARYRETVLVAFAEVESNLTAQHLLASEREQNAAALQAARAQLAVAANRYRAGLETFLPVAVAQVSALERERADVRLRGQQFVAAVGLVKALGGGWERGPGNEGQTLQ